MFFNIKLATLSVLSLAASTLAREAILERDGRAVFLAKRRFGQEHPAAIDLVSNACGGGACATIAGSAISTLLAASPECAQQDKADEMIDLANTLTNANEKAALIAAAIKFRQAEKNTPPDFTTNPPTPRNSVFCQKAPKNAQLNGLVQAQDPANGDIFFDPATKASVKRGAQANTFPFGTNGGAAAPPAQNDNGAADSGAADGGAANGDGATDAGAANGNGAADTGAANGNGAADTGAANGNGAADNGAANGNGAANNNGAKKGKGKKGKGKKGKGKKKGGKKGAAANNGAANNGAANNGAANNGAANNGSANNGGAANDNGAANNGGAANDNGAANNDGAANDNGAADSGAAAPAQGDAAAAGDLQKFTEALGGVKAPAVTANGQQFAVAGNASFNNLQSALVRSCDVQNNKCSDASNGAGNNKTFSVGDCNAQQAKCITQARQS